MSSDVIYVLDVQRSKKYGVSRLYVLVRHQWTLTNTCPCSIAPITNYNINQCYQGHQIVRQSLSNGRASVSITHILNNDVTLQSGCSNQLRGLPWQQGAWGQHGPIWGRQNPGGSHVGPKNLAMWVRIYSIFSMLVKLIFSLKIQV